MDATTIEELMAPIGDNGVGGDVTYNSSFRDLKSGVVAARAVFADEIFSYKSNLEAPSWAGGDQDAPSWMSIENIAKNILIEESKDMRAAAYLTEALGYQYGFSGLADGFDVMNEIVSRYPDDFYPQIDDGDADERADAIGNLKEVLPPMFSMIPLVDQTARSQIWVCMYKWQEALKLESLSASNPSEYSNAIERGEHTKEDMLECIGGSAASYLKGVQLDLERLEESYTTFSSTVRECLKQDTPSMGGVLEAIQTVKACVHTLCEQAGVSEDVEKAVADGATSEQALSDFENEEIEHAQKPDGASAMNGQLRSREDAIKMIQKCSVYMKKIEPHSPVPYLLDRAVKWANMPFSDWIKEMVDDDSVLRRINEHMGVEEEDEN